MELAIILLGSGLVIFCLFYGVRKVSQLSHTLNVTKIELEKSQAAEQHLKDEAKALEHKLQDAFTDPVTQLPTWQLFEDQLNRSLKESARFQLSLGVLLIDLDDFKVINDALGYEVGDALLQQVAERLKPCIRQVDSVSRITKDTFVILLAQLNKPETAALVAQRILQALANPFQINEHELYITTCIGISVYPTDGEEVQSLLRSADHALQLAKARGKHFYQFAQEKLHAQSQRELTLYTSLNHETIFEEFILYYQPVVNTHNETIMCMDALLHWQHPSLGLIHPQELFSYADKQHKLDVLTEWLLKNACRQFLEWRKLGFYPDLLGIPLSIKQLENSHFIYRISQILQELEFKPEWLLLELRGGSVELPFNVLEKAFNMLKFIGLKVAINDFGAGFFPLYYLKNFTIHYLKLDRSLIDEIETNHQAVALLEALVFLAQKMSMQLIVQGVESEQQVMILKELDFILMQGQQLGVPLSEREVASKMVVSS